MEGGREAQRVEGGREQKERGREEGEKELAGEHLVSSTHRFLSS